MHTNTRHGTTAAATFRRAILPLCGLAFTEAWTFTMFFENAAYPAAGDPAAVRHASYLVSLIFLAITLIGLGLLPAAFHRRSRRLCVVAAGLMAVSSLCALGADLQGAGLALLAASAVASGIGSGAMAMLWAIAFYRVGPRSMIAAPLVTFVAFCLEVLVHSLSTPTIAAALFCVASAAFLLSLPPKSITAPKPPAISLRPTTWGYAPTWLAFGIALGLLNDMSGYGADGPTGSTLWLFAIGASAFVLIFVLAFMDADLPLCRADRNKTIESGIEGPCDDISAQQRRKSAFATAGLLVPFVLLVSVLSLAIPDGHIGGFSVAAARPIVCYVLLDVLMLAILTQSAALMGLRITVVYGFGRAGRVLGTLLGSMLFDTLLSSPASAASHGDSLETLAAVALCEILVALTFPIAHKKSQSRTMANGVEGEAESPIDVLGAASRLTNREIDVFRLLARGYTQQRIQNELGIAPSTALTHIHHIYQKLGVHSKQELIDLVEKARLPQDTARRS